MAQYNNRATGQAPELLDKIFGEIGDGLTAGLPWLDNAFGRAERLVKYDDNNRRIYIPCWYTHDNEYIELTPTDSLGNFSFFWVDDPQDVEWVPRQEIGLTTDFAIIFWYDFRKIYNETNRNREQVKADILYTLNTMTLSSGSFRVSRVMEQAENIYSGWSLDETDNQFLMAPYGGVRIEGRLQIMENCRL